LIKVLKGRVGVFDLTRRRLRIFKRF